MLKFNVHALMEGDIVGVRSTTKFGHAIRAILGSYTTHNGLIVFYEGEWYVLEAIPPVSVLTPLSVYESAMTGGTIVRVWRVPGVSPMSRHAAAMYAVHNLLGIPYPVKQMWKLLIFRFVNHFPIKIRGKWCTRLSWDAWGHVDPNIFNRPDGKRKKNPTPRTFENRLIAGVIRDQTRTVITAV